jgi:RsiW-degrading membrane proteinase PrsW (M82 family)
MPEKPECCICGEPVEPPYHMLGQRVYCARHYALVNKSHSGFWRAGLIQIAGVGVFSGAVALLAGLLPPLSGTPLVLAGLVLAIVPAVVWLIFFYRQDRLEPEPKARIAHVFLLALLLADVVGVRLIRDWMRLPDWATLDTTTSLLASILVIGFTYQAIAYVAVRAVVYATAEFDERMDGIVYGTVAGLGVATLMNLRYIIENGGVALAPGVIRVTTTSLALASFSGLMGYFMAQAKFEHKPAWWVPLGLVVAAVLNGLFSWLISEVSASGMTVDPWRSLLLGLAVALAVFLVLVTLMSRVTAVTLRRERASR